MTNIPSERRMLAAAFFAALVLRFIAAGLAGPISQDGAAFYLPNARLLFEGGFSNSGALSVAVPPLHAYLVALLAYVMSDVESAAIAISVVAGAAMVFPACGISRHTPLPVLSARTVQRSICPTPGFSSKEDSRTAAP